VLNKLSENNIDNLLVEFINNIGQISIEEYNIIQKTFYIKILSEINFVKVYLKFFNYINTIYNKVQNYDMKYFISIIETKFYNDYTDDIKIDEEYKFINEFNTESHRINNLMIIQNLIHINIFNNDLCINKAINTFNINLANNPDVGEIRTTNIKAYMVYPANISITELRDLSVAPGVLGEFVSTSNYLNVTGATTTLPGNTYTAGTPYQALTISGVPYRILQFPPTAGGALGATGSYRVTTCN
jgi:hypothetical protein